MALTAIDSVRQAELDAQKSIEEAQLEANAAENSAKLKAGNIIDDAKEAASIRIAVEKDRVSKKAEEIVVTAKNNAILEADALKIKCADKQEIINKKIVSMIV